ncbi:MAG: hypothetical protein ABS52_19310 [Gemmatimonadetes bacterium SCN 70-22]|nr:MAG: hypothetical protein ABS52_19310 [Gemmatimonadetes bacterium SCN 70-22]
MSIWAQQVTRLFHNCIGHLLEPIAEQAGALAGVPDVSALSSLRLRKPGPLALGPHVEVVPLGGAAQGDPQ